MPLSRKKIERLWYQADEPCWSPAKRALVFARLVEAAALDRLAHGRVAFVITPKVNAEQKLLRESGRLGVTPSWCDCMLRYHRDQARKALKEGK